MSILRWKEYKNNVRSGKGSLGYNKNIIKKLKKKQTNTFFSYQISCKACIILDTTIAASPRGQAVQKMVAKFGGIDAAFANAGTRVNTPGTEHGDPKEWRRLVDINIMGALYTTSVVLPELKKGKGTLVLTGLAVGHQDIRDYTSLLLPSHIHHPTISQLLTRVPTHNTIPLHDSISRHSILTRHKPVPTHDPTSTPTNDNNKVTATTTLIRH